MTTTILESFLDAGLLPFIGDDDAKLAHLKATSTDLQAAFRDNPRQLVAASLVALDADTPDDDPILEMTEAALHQHWRTVRAASGNNRPVALLRAILLDALARVGETSLRDAAIIWYTADRPTPLPLPPHESPIIEPLLQRLGDIVEQGAEDEWAAPSVDSPGKVPTITLSLPPKLVNSLIAKFVAAAGPNDAAGTALPEANPRFPVADAEWATEFGKRAASATVGAVSAAQDQWQRQFNAALREILEYVEGQITPQTDHRTQLLWWREACYSPSLRRSYRSLEPRLVVIAMAADLVVQVPVLHPQSVEFFLREAVAAVVASKQLESIESASLIDWATGLAELPSASEVKGILGEASGGRGRLSLLEATWDILTRSSDESAALERLGVQQDCPLPLPDIAVWLFRDLQASRLTSSADIAIGASQDEEGDDE